MFTGQRPWNARSLQEQLSARADAEPTAPSSLVPELDRDIGRLIMSCLAREPAARPSSALVLLATLPGGDPLQAAIARGETPSPEMVAAAGVVGDLTAKAAARGVVSASKVDQETWEARIASLGWTRDHAEPSRSGERVGGERQVSPSPSAAPRRR